MYGPTKGPPSPTGAAPAGCRNSVLVSAIARARLIRPLPVWDWVPAGSAVRARRLTMTPLLSEGSCAFIRPAAPATTAAAAEVPLTTSYPSPIDVVDTSTPGAAMNTAEPLLLNAASASAVSVAATPMTPRSPAGKVGSLEALLPAAATTTTPRAQA